MTLRRKRKLSPAKASRDRKIVFEYVYDKKSLRNLAKEHSISYQRVSQILHEHDVKMRPGGPHEEG